MCHCCQQDLVSSTSFYYKYPLIAPFIYLFCLYCILYQAIMGLACQQIRPIHLPPCDGLALVICWTCLYVFFLMLGGEEVLSPGTEHSFSPVMLRLGSHPLPQPSQLLPHFIMTQHHTTPPSPAPITPSSPPPLQTPTFESDGDFPLQKCIICWFLPLFFLSVELGTLRFVLGSAAQHAMVCILAFGCNMVSTSLVRTFTRSHV